MPIVYQFIAPQEVDARFEPTIQATFGLSESISQGGDVTETLTLDPTIDLVTDQTVSVPEAAFEPTIQATFSMDESVTQGSEVTETLSLDPTLDLTTDAEVVLPEAAFEPTIQASFGFSDSVSSATSSVTESFDLSPTISLTTDASVDLPEAAFEPTVQATFGFSDSVSGNPTVSESFDLSPTISLTTSATAQGAHPTDPLTVDATWDDVNTDYTDLSPTSKASARIEATIAPGDEGLLMESGASGNGLAVYIWNDGTWGEEEVIIEAGNGGSGGPASDIALARHQLNYRHGVQDVDDSADTIYISGDKRWQVDVGESVYVTGSGNTHQVTGLAYDVLGAGRTQITVQSHSYQSTQGLGDCVLTAERDVVVEWSGQSPEGTPEQVVLYVDGVPVDADPVENSELGGGNEGGIEIVHNGVRNVLAGWTTNSQYAYGNSVAKADIFQDEITGEVATYGSEILTLDATWDDPSVAYSDLNNASRACGRVFARIESDDAGILMESGGTGDGLILYVYNGVLYFQCGDAGSTGDAFNRAECQWSLPSHGAYVIEWAADDSGYASLWVNGVRRDTEDSWSNSQICGGSNGAIAGSRDLTPPNRGGYGTSTDFVGTVTKAEIYVGEAFGDSMSWTATAFAYDSSAGTSQHDALYSGGIHPYDFRIYESSSESNLVYSNTDVDGHDAGDSGYSTQSFSSGDSVWFRLEDAEGNVITQSVSVQII